MSVHFPMYTKTRLTRAALDWWRGRGKAALTEVPVSVLGAIIAAVVAFKVGADFELWRPAIVGVIAGVATYVAVAASMFVWHWWVAPSRIYADQQSKIHTLQGRVHDLTRSGPWIDPRLELVDAAMELAPLDDDLDRKLTIGLPKSPPDPDRRLVVRLRALDTIDPPVLWADCDGPIYRGMAQYQRPSEDRPIFVLDPHSRSGKRVAFEFSRAPLPAGTWFRLYLYSPTDIELTAAGVARRAATPQSSTRADAPVGQVARKE